MRVLVTGSRTWDDAETIYWTFRNWWEQAGRPEKPTLVSGHCPRGADALAEYIWSRNGWPLELHPAEWDLYGRKAGFIRNEQMVRSNPDILFAFIKDQSKGATHTLKLARFHGIPAIVTEM